MPKNTSYSDKLYPKSHPPRQCPDCGEPMGKRPAFDQCTLYRTLLLWIPAGEHRHIKCPVHGSHRIDGPPISL